MHSSVTRTIFPENFTVNFFISPTLAVYIKHVFPFYIVVFADCALSTCMVIVLFPVHSCKWSKLAARMDWIPLWVHNCYLSFCRRPLNWLMIGYNYRTHFWSRLKLCIAPVDKPCTTVMVHLVYSCVNGRTSDRVEPLYFYAVSVENIKLISLTIKILLSRNKIIESRQCPSQCHHFKLMVING